MSLGEPDWLNKEFLLKCLQADDNYGGNIEVIEFKSEPVVPEGNNYGSCIIRVKLELKKMNELKTQALSLIIKSPLQSGIQANILESLQNVESKFYCQLLPLVKHLGINSFFPKCYNSPNPDIIVMEDLKEEGYVMQDRCLQLDYDHCLNYAVVAATFHAVSIAAHRVNAELVESLGEEKLFGDSLKPTETYKVLMQYGVDCTSDYMEKSEFKKYAKLVRESKSYLLNLVIKAHKLSEVMNSLNQGDPWTPNMMFKYDENGKVCGIKLLDFQALRYGSPINDLVFFLWSSANHDVRENRMNDFYQTYCDTLNKKLQEFNCSESLDLNDLMLAVKELNPLMLFIVVAFLPMQVNPNSVDIADLLSIKKDENGQPVNNLAKYFTDYYCDNFLSRYLKQLDHNGVFEYLERHANK